MGVINTETGAISNFLWVEAQDGIKQILEDISATQSIINPDYAFTVYSNKFTLSDGDFEDTKAMINIRIGQVECEDVTNFSATHKVTYFLDCYALGKNEDDPVSTGLVPADEAAVQHLHYLVSMAYYGMTSLKNFYKKLQQGKIVPGAIGIVFNPVKDAENSAEPYAPAQITFTCKFPYTAEDLSGLPAYKATFVDLGAWASRIFTD